MKAFRLNHAAHTVRCFMHGALPYPRHHQWCAVRVLLRDGMSINDAWRLAK